MKLKYITPLFFICFFFTSCGKEDKKENAKTPTSQAPAKEKKNPVNPSKPTKTGIPAVEAARGIGKDLEKNAEKSNKLLEDAMGGH